MFKVKRVSTVPASPLRVLVSAQQDDPKDAGLAAGGSFYFYPAGSEDGESEFSMDEATARAIMEDRGLVVHFECTPALPSAHPAAGISQAADAGPTTPASRKRSRSAHDDVGQPATE